MENQKKYIAPATRIQHITYLEEIMDDDIPVGSTGNNDQLSKIIFLSDFDVDVDDDLTTNDLWDDNY